MHTQPPGKLALLALILANLIPLFGVLYLGWDVGSLVVLYWSENLVTGAFTMLRMLVTGGARALPLVLFFCLHYGGFCAVHGVVVLELTQFAAADSVEPAVQQWPGPLALVQQILAAAPTEFLWAVLALLLSHGASFLLLFLGQGEYRHSTLKQLMNAPYKRIVVLHVAVIAGGFLVVKMGAPVGLLIALVALKTGMDIMLHRRSHREFSMSGGNSAGNSTQGEA